RDHPWRARMSEAIFPCYIIHQTIIVVVAWWLLPAQLPPLPAFGLVLAVTAAGSWLFYRLGREIFWLRPLIGLRIAQPKLGRRPGGSRWAPHRHRRCRFGSGVRSSSEPCSILLLRTAAFALLGRGDTNAAPSQGFAQQHLDLRIDAAEVGRRGALERAPEGRLDAQRIGFLRVGHRSRSYW